jgi:hypothetical protein
MTTKHTPGPWSTRESATHITVTSTSGDALFHDDKRIPGVIEDARLIAAAPELLAELITMADAYSKAMKDAGVSSYPEALGIVRSARAAIAKATAARRAS